MKNLLQKTVLLTMIFGAVLTAQDKSAEKFGAQLFFDYTNHISNSGGNANNEFEINRAYLSYQNNYSEEISYKFIIDGDRTDADNKRLEVFVKNAMIEYKTKYGTISGGLMGMNMFTLQEANWGYRFVEKSAMDINKFSSSADLAIGYANTLSGVLDVNFMISNGEGFKSSETNRYKKYSLSLAYGEKKLFSKNGFNIGSSVSIEPTQIADKNELTTVYGIFGGFSVSGFRLGAEFDQKFSKNQQSVSKTEMIVSAYASYSFTDNFDMYTRADVYDPNNKTYNDGYNYFLGGFTYSPAKALSIAPNVRVKQAWADGSDPEVDFKVNFLFKI